MKKILSVISLVLMLLMSACNSTQPDNEQKSGETVTADNADQTVQSAPEMPSDKNEISEKVQENVKTAVQNMTNVTVSRVNLVIAGLAAEEQE